MIGKIPKDHGGLYACEPFNHGIQTNVTEKMIKANLDKYEISGDKRKMKKENKALELFQYGYEDSVIAARSELPIEDVKELRKARERWE